MPSETGFMKKHCPLCKASTKICFTTAFSGSVYKLGKRKKGKTYPFFFLPLRFRKRAYCAACAALLHCRTATRCLYHPYRLLLTHLRTHWRTHCASRCARRKNKGILAARYDSTMMCSSTLGRCHHERSGGDDAHRAESDSIANNNTSLTRGKKSRRRQQEEQRRVKAGRGVGKRAPHPRWPRRGLPAALRRGHSGPRRPFGARGAAGPRHDGIRPPADCCCTH